MPNMSTRTGETAVELWVCGHRCGDDDGHEVFADRLERFVETGRIDDFTVREWPHEVDVTSPDVRSPHEQLVRERVAEFRQWAHTYGMTLPEFDETSTVGVGRMGPEHTALVMPATVLAVYRDDDLQWVAPCRKRGRLYTVADWFDAVEHGIDPDPTRPSSLARV